MAVIFQDLDVTELAEKQAAAWIFDIENSKMWWANAQAIELWSAADLEELLSRDFTDMSDATQIRLHNYQQAFHRGETVEETWTFYPKGEAKQVYTIATGIVLPGGAMALSMEAFPSSLLKLSHNELRMVEAVRHVDVCMCLFSEEGENLLMNPAAMRTLNLKPKDSQSQAPTLWALFSDVDERDKLKRTFGKEGDLFVETQIHTTMGQRWHAIHLRRSKDPSNGHDVILFDSKDIHERMHLTTLLEQERTQLSERVMLRTQELQESNQALHLAVQTRDRFLATMSHELRTPLNAIIGYSEMLQEEELALNRDPVFGEWLSNILESSAHLLSLVEDVLDLSSLMSEHRMELERKIQCLQPLCEACVRKILPLAHRKSLRVDTVYLDETIEAMVDGRRFKQMLLNLLVNAIKFTPSGRSIGIKLATQPEGDVVITIWDEGIGIPSEFIAMLFEPFKQLKQPGTLSKGIGLGLALTQQMAALHGGHVKVDSAPGKGSSFHLVLPNPNHTG